MKVNTDKKAIQEVLTRGVQEILVEKDLYKKMSSGQQLRVKHGIDPTSSDLHLGYAVVYNKLRQLQEMGHKIVFLIGSFTARFGDPTDKDKSRNLRSKEEVLALGEDYVRQLSKILDIDKIELRYNGEWYDKYSAEDLLKLMSKFTVARMLERDMFKKRIADEKEIYYHEPVYPMLQGWDSVELKSDLTVIGSDQKFNELQARPLQEEAGQVPQDLIMVPLLLGTDGVNKMSQSLGNYIGVAEPANEQFGKIMSIPDKLIYPYFELCTRISADELSEIEKEFKSGVNPKDLKVRLAKEIINIYHGATAASQAEEEFNKIFRDKGKPTDMPEFKTDSGTSLVEILVNSKIVSSKSEVRRLVEQGGVRVNDQVVDVWDGSGFKSGDIIQVGKRRFLKIK